MSDKDNITLPRKHINYAAHALEHFNKDAPNQLVFEIVHHLRAALAAPRPEPVRHPGYVVGNHWLETAYERLCAGESEDAILEDYELVREPRLRDLRLDSERYRWVLERAWFQFEFDGRYGDSGETVQQLDAAVGEAMDASTAPAAAPEPATEPAIDAAMGDKT